MKTAVSSSPGEGRAVGHPGGAYLVVQAHGLARRAAEVGLENVLELLSGPDHLRRANVGLRAVRTAARLD